MHNARRSSDGSPQSFETSTSQYPVCVSPCSLPGIQRCRDRDFISEKPPKCATPFFSPLPRPVSHNICRASAESRGTTTSHQAQLLNHGVASGDGSLGRRSRGRLRFPAVTIHATAATASRVGAVALWVSAGVSDAGRHTWRRSPHALRLWPCCRRGSCCSRGLGRSGPGAHDAATGGHASATPKVCFFAGWKRWCVLKVVLGRQQIDTYCSRCWDTPWPGCRWISSRLREIEKRTRAAVELVAHAENRSGLHARKKKGWLQQGRHWVSYETALPLLNLPPRGATARVERSTAFTVDVLRGRACCFCAVWRST